MSNIRLRGTKSSFRNVLFCLLLSGGVFLPMTPPSITMADTSTVGCDVLKIESHILYRFVNSKHHQGLRDYRDQMCRRVEDGRWSLEKANKYIASWESRCGICRGWSVNPGYEEFILKELKSPDSILLAHRKFCRDTYQSRTWASMNLKDTPKRVAWLQTEIFCGWTNHIANPGGWMEAFRPDLPCFKRLEERADSLCDDLRGGRIAYDQAWYLWELEMLEFEKNATPEAVRRMAENLKAPIDFLINMFK